MHTIHPVACLGNHYAYHKSYNDLKTDLNVTKTIVEPCKEHHI